VLAATPIVRYFAYRAKLVDKPDDLLKPHRLPVAYLGGVSLCLGLLAGLAYFTLTIPDLSRRWAQIGHCLSEGRFTALWENPIWNLLGVALGSITIMGVGLLDDLKNIKPKHKVYGQLLAGLCLLIGGVGMRMGAVVLSPLGLSQYAWLMVPLSAAALLVVVVAICNAANLLDGLDGLCGGVIAFVAIGFVFFSTWLTTWGHVSGIDELRVALSLAMTGAVLGFLPYNAPPASIFMGDAGSMLLGFLVATMMAMFCQEGHPRWFLASCVVFSVPILDSALAVVRRIIAKRSIFAGDRSHLYDQLVDRGMAVKQVVGLFYVVCLVTTIFGLAMAVYVRIRYAVPIYLALFITVWILFYKFGLITPKERSDSSKSTVPPREKLNLLFCSAGRRVALLQEFRRGAHDLGIGLVMHATDHNPLAPALQVADCIAIMPSVGPGYIESLLAYCRKNRIDAVIPLIDPELPLLSDAQEDFVAAGTKVIISSPETIRISMDKVLTTEFLVENGFRTPRILSNEELRKPSYPLFVKPRDGSSSAEARKITDQQALDYHLHVRPELIVQEFIDGAEHTVDVFVDFDCRPRCAVPRLRYEVRSGEVSKGQTVQHARIMQESCRMIEVLGGCVGMTTIQCFLTPEDEIVFIEINPRFGGGVPLSIRAGADSPRWILELLLGRQPSISTHRWTNDLFMLRFDQAFFCEPKDLPAKET
jgi:carbamoyl-phosphate synthase large subunit